MATPRLFRPSSLDQVVDALARMADAIEFPEPWREIGSGNNPAFQNSWANLGGTVETAAFYKDALGIVHIKGNITSPAGIPNGNGTVAFTLPEGYRPAKSHRFGTHGTDATTVYVSQVIVAATGTVSCFLRGPGANTVVTEISLDVCHFRAL